MVRAIAAALSGADPDNAERYADNAGTLIARLTDLDTGLGLRLAPVADKPYIVFHDAYAYLETRYGLRAVGSVTVSPERPPGAKRVAAIRERIRNSQSICVFDEPQFPPRLVQTLTEGTGARTGTLDPLGLDLAAGPDLYFVLMDDLGDALATCLSG
jgi:zinc transport system substrate-binding protein